jgi:anti-sigma factor RsiW
VKIMNTCTDAHPLIMSYLDGELSEAQAAPLRKHLLECQPCRASAQDQKNLKRWFQDAEPVAIPRDFAARVARRAFQGDRGEAFAPAAELASTRETRHLRLVMALTAIAAALVIFLSVAIRGLSLPGNSLIAVDKAEPRSIESVLEELDQVNARETGAQTPKDTPRGEVRRP